MVIGILIPFDDNCFVKNSLYIKYSKKNVKLLLLRYADKIQASANYFKKRQMPNCVVRTRCYNISYLS